MTLNLFFKLISWPFRAVLGGFLFVLMLLAMGLLFLGYWLLGANNYAVPHIDEGRFLIFSALALLFLAWGYWLIAISLTLVLAAFTSGVTERGFISPSAFCDIVMALAIIGWLWVAFKCGRWIRRKSSRAHLE